MTLPQGPGDFGVRKWVTLGLVIPVGIASGLFGVLVGLSGVFDDGITTAGHIAFGVFGLLLVLVAVRAPFVGFLVTDDLVRIRGVWATRTVVRRDVAGFVMESDASGAFHIPAVVATDGGRIRARWAFRRARGGSHQVAQEIVDAFDQRGWYDETRLDTALNSRDALRREPITTYRWQSPPTWPAPPAGWRPHPGWHPPPMWGPAPPDWQFWARRDVPVVVATDVEADPDEAPEGTPAHLDTKYALDLEVAKGLPNSNWGLGEALQGFGWFALLAALLIPLGVYVSGTLASLLTEACIGLAVYLAARKAAGQSGGWGRALGWELPKLRESWFAFRWFGWNSLGGAVAGIIVGLLTLPLAGKDESNVDVSRHDSVLALLVAILGAVFVAPIVEEFFFRGLLLHAAMRRFNFLTSAIVTSVIFGGAHVYEVHNLRSRILVGVTISTFGFIQAMLARRRPRLGPSMWVHGFHNAFVVVFVLL